MYAAMRLVCMQCGQPDSIVFKVGGQGDFLPKVEGQCLDPRCGRKYMQSLWR